MATFTHADLEGLWITAGGLPGTADTAAAIAQAESSGCQYAKHGPTDDRPVKQCVYTFSTKENSYGLWQINRMAHPQYSAATLWNALGNAQASVEISNGGVSFSAWTTYKDGSYAQYLQAGGVPTPQPAQPLRPGIADTPTSATAWRDTYRLSSASLAAPGKRRCGRSPPAVE